MNNRTSLRHTRVIQLSDDAHSHPTSNNTDANKYHFWKSIDQIWLWVHWKVYDVKLPQAADRAYSWGREQVKLGYQKYFLTNCWILLSTWLNNQVKFGSEFCVGDSLSDTTVFLSLPNRLILNIYEFAAKSSFNSTNYNY